MFVRFIRIRLCLVPIMINLQDMTDTVKPKEAFRHRNSAGMRPATWTGADHLLSEMGTAAQTDTATYPRSATPAVCTVPTAHRVLPAEGGIGWFDWRELLTGCGSR